MKKLISVLCLSIFSSHAFADTPDFAKYFQGKNACFILFDTNQNKIVTEYNSKRCETQISPDSTFKIALSLMAFDQQLISQQTIFKWNGTKHEYAVWNQNQTPQSWLKNSVVWVSQDLTTKMGDEKIKNYLQEFNYGNKDFSGTPGKNDGLTAAWIENSLKISPKEQLIFLNDLVTNKIPVSQDALDNTKANMYLETSPTQWKLYGKTGSGCASHHFINYQHELQNGWFIGYVQKDKQTYVFVLNFADVKKPKISAAAGMRAENMTKAILNKMDVF